MKIKIKVTKKVLEITKMCSNTTDVGKHCAIAYAVREIFPNAIVDCGVLAFDVPQDVCSWGCTDYPHVKLTNRVCDFIEKFDSKLPADRVRMPEFSFDIKVPASVIDKIGIGECYKILSESKTLELVSIN